MTPIRSIRRYCIGRCMNKSRKRVRECADGECPLNGFRMGVRPETLRKQNLREVPR